jgi:rRNA maturation endonuclease Nob1
MASKDHMNAFERWPWARSVGRNTAIISNTMEPNTLEGYSMYAICGKCMQKFQSIDIPDDKVCPGCGAESYRNSR